MPHRRQAEEPHRLTVPWHNRILGGFMGVLCLGCLSLTGVGAVYLLEHFWGGRTWEIGVLTMASLVLGLIFGALAWHQFWVAPQREAEAEAYRAAVRQRVDDLARQRQAPPHPPRVDLDQRGEPGEAKDGD